MHGDPAMRTLARMTCAAVACAFAGVTGAAAQPATLGCTSDHPGNATQTLRCGGSVTIAAEGGAKFTLRDRDRNGSVDSIDLQSFKIGAHFGPIVAFRLGGDSYQHITATGGSVNVASRLMKVAARQGAALALGDDLLRQVGPECALIEFGVLTGPRETRIGGRSRALSVWLWRNDSTGVDESDPNPSVRPPSPY
jgi:class 3 adenylate cyclase